VLFSRGEQLNIARGETGLNHWQTREKEKGDPTFYGERGGEESATADLVRRKTDFTRVKKGVRRIETELKRVGKKKDLKITRKRSRPETDAHGESNIWDRGGLRAGSAS